MDEDFKEELQNVIEHLLSPDRLVVKESNEMAVYASQFYELILSYFEQFKSEDLPEAVSIFEAAIKSHMMSIVDECFSLYKENFTENSSVENIGECHEIFKEMALLKYQNAKKMGGQEYEVEYREILEKQIDELFEVINETHRKLQEGVEKERKELEEKNRELQEQMERERIANVERLRLEQERHNMQVEQYERLRREVEENHQIQRDLLKYRQEEVQTQTNIYDLLKTLAKYAAIVAVIGIAIIYLPEIAVFLSRIPRPLVLSILGNFISPLSQGLSQ